MSSVSGSFFDAQSIAPSRASFKSAASSRASFKSAASSAARSFRSARSRLSRGSSRSGRSSLLRRALSRPRRATSMPSVPVTAPVPYYSGPPLALNSLTRARVPNMTAPIPNSNSNSSWNNIVPSRAPQGFTQYGTAQTGRRYFRTLANAPQSQNDRLLTNAVLRHTNRLRELLIKSGMDPKLATSRALAKLDTFLEPNIRQVTRSVAVKQMRAAASASVQAQRERAAASARAAKTFAVARAQAMKQRAVAMKEKARAMQRRQANRSAALWSRAVGGAAAAQKSMARGGQAMWQGTTKAATTAAAAMAAEARRSRNGIVGGARSTARVFDSRVVAPINMGVMRPVRGAAYERRVEKILTEMDFLKRKRNMLKKVGRNVNRVKKINAALSALNAEKNRINATRTIKNEKPAGWAWLQKFGRRR